MTSKSSIVANQPVPQLVQSQPPRPTLPPGTQIPQPQQQMTMQISPGQSSLGIPQPQPQQQILYNPQQGNYSNLPPTETIFINQNGTQVSVPPGSQALPPQGGGTYIIRHRIPYDANTNEVLDQTYSRIGSVPQSEFNTPLPYQQQQQQPQPQQIQQQN